MIVCRLFLGCWCRCLGYFGVVYLILFVCEQLNFVCLVVLAGLVMLVVGLLDCGSTWVLRCYVCCCFRSVANYVCLVGCVQVFGLLIGCLVFLFLFACYGALHFNSN